MCRNLHTHTHTHTHGCLCKIIIPIIATFAITIPSFANIDKDAQSATCDNFTIGTTTGPANLQADWTANTINLDFYSNDTKVGTGSCTYDGGIELPNTPEVPTGYTFGGWKLRAAAAPAPVKQCWEMNQQECEAAEECVYSAAFDTCRVFTTSCSSVLSEVDCDHYGLFDDVANDGSVCAWTRNKCVGRKAAPKD